MSREKKEKKCFVQTIAREGGLEARMRQENHGA